MDFQPAEISQIDYTKGRLDFLSALTGETTITVSPS